MKTKLAILIFARCGFFSFAVQAQNSTAPQEMPISISKPKPPGQTGLRRPVGDGNLWTFRVVPEPGIVWVEGPNWSYPGKGAGSDPDWGQWGGGDGQMWLSWISPQKAAPFKIRMTGKIGKPGGGGGRPIDVEASWEGEVRDPRNWQIEPDWYVGDIETEHRIVPLGSSIFLWMNAFDEDRWETANDEGIESDELTYTWSVKPVSGTGPAGDLVEFEEYVYWNTPEEPGWYTITCVVNDKGEVTDPDTGERDDGEWEVSINLLVVDVQLSPDPLQLDVDETGTLTATVRPPDAPVTFEIRNSAIATLAGTAPTLTITGVADGTTAIIAKAEGREIARSIVIVGDGDGDDDGGGDDDDDGGGGDDDDDGGGGPDGGGPVNPDDPGGPEMPCDMDLDADQIKRSSAHLFWSRCRDDNFVSYKLYRSTEEDFTPSESTHINRGALETQQSKTDYDDTGLAAATTYYYVLVTTHDGQSTEARTSFTTPDASTPELSFEGLARSCAGGVAVDGVHDFTIIGTLRDEDGNIMANAPLTFSFEGNKGHNYQAGERIDNQTGVLHRAKYLPDAAIGQVEVTGSDGEEMTAITDAEGKVSIKVLSSDIISNDIKMVAKWLNAQGQEKQIGSKACDFGEVDILRRFPNQFDPHEIEDSGWLIDIPRLSAVNASTPAKVYLKFMIDPTVGDINGNWKEVNGHQLLMKIVSVSLREGAEVTDPALLKNYAVVVDANNSNGETRMLITSVDGAAQAIVKAKENIGNAREIVVGADNLTQWEN